VDEEDPHKRLECFERREAESGVESFEESRCLAIQSVKENINTDIDESDCIVIQKGGGEVGKRGVGLWGPKGPADADAGAPSLEAGEGAENGGGVGWAMITRRKSKAASVVGISP
jgi:hypothetical protein